MGRLARLSVYGGIPPSESEQLEPNVGAELDRRVMEMRNEEFKEYAELHVELTKLTIESLADFMKALARR